MKIKSGNDLGPCVFSKLLYSWLSLTQALSKALKQIQRYKLWPLLLFGSCEKAARH